MFVSDSAGLPSAGELTTTTFTLTAAGDVKGLPPIGAADEGLITFLPIDGEVTILPFPLPTGDGVFTIMPFPMPADGPVTLLPFDFDFSAVSSIALDEFDFSALDWNALLPEELVQVSSFGFKSFSVQDGLVTLTLLDGSVYEVSLGTSEPVSIEAGRLMVDPSTLTGTLLDGFNAGWI